MPDRLATLVPYPATVRARPGQLALHRDTPVRAGPAARQAADPVRQVLAALPWPPSPPRASDARQEILVDADGTLPAEGYRLLIGPDRVKITAAGPAGAFYAAQTIRQLLPDAAFRAAPVAGPGLDAALRGDRGRARAVLARRSPRRVPALLPQAHGPRLHRHAGRAQAEPAAPAPDRRPGLADREPPPSRPAPDRVAPAADPGRPLLASWHRTAGRLRRHPARRLLHARRSRRDRRLRRAAHDQGRPRGRGARARAARCWPRCPSSRPTPGARYEVATGWGIKSQIVAPFPDTVAVLGEIFGELLGAIPADFVHIGGDECVLDDWRSSSRVEEYRRQLGPARS